MANGDIWDKISRDIDATQGGVGNVVLPQDTELTQGIDQVGDANFSPDAGLSVGLPPNENGNDIANRVDAATIGQFSPPGEQLPSTDVQFIQNQINPLGNQQLALPGVTQEMFTPGINLPLRVGGTSGQLTGSRDIFVAQNQAVPFALLERRRAMQQQAALKRAQDLDRFKLRKPALSKDPRFNRNLVQTANEFTDIFVDRATKQFGSREAGLAALTNPGTKIGREFAQQMDNLEILAGEVDQVVDLNAEVSKAIEEGDQYVSDDTLKLFNEFQTLSGEFEAGDAFGAASFRNKLTELQTSQSLDQYMKNNDVLSNIEGVILQRAGIDDTRADQFRQTTRFTKNFEEGARSQAKAIKNNIAFRNRQDLTEDDIFNRIMALKGKVDKRTATVKAKPIRDGFTSKEQVPVSKDPKAINIGTNQFQTKISVPYSQKAQSKPILFSGAVAISQDGKPIIRKGQINFRPVENHVVTTKDGIERRVVTGKEIINVNDLTNEQRKALGISPLSKQKTIERDVTLDYDNIEGALRGLSADARASADAFNDVSAENKRNKVFLNQDNSSQFIDAMIDADIDNPDEFISTLAKEQGQDVIPNEQTQQFLQSKEFLKEFKRKQSQVKRSAR